MTTIRLLGRKGETGPWGVINAYGADNAAVAVGAMPVFALRRKALWDRYQWERGYHLDWQFKVEEEA